MTLSFGKYVLLLLTLGIPGGCSTPLPPGVPTNPLAHSYVHDGTSIHYKDVGAGRAVVFIHGFGASLEVWRQMEDALKDEYRLVLFDLKGHGYSARPHDDRYSLKDHAAVVLGLLEHLKLDNVVLVGHSYGCAVALMASLQAQESFSGKVSGLVLIAGSIDPENLPFYLRLLRLPVIGWVTANLTPVDIGTRRILKRAYHDDERVTESLIERYAKYQRIAGSAHALLTTARQMVPPDFSALRQELQSLKLPVLKIIGKYDEIISPDSGKALCRILPNCRAVIIDDVGHVPHDEKPGETIPLVRDFIAKVDSQRGRLHESCTRSNGRC